MTETNSRENAVMTAMKPPFVSNYGLVLTVYILYILGFFTGLSALIGVVIGSLQDDNVDEVCRSHFRFQVRTFWIGLLYLFLAVLTFHFGIVALVLLWWLVWTLVRCTKGMLALNRGQPIGDPLSWLFG